MEPTAQEKQLAMIVHIAAAGLTLVTGVFGIIVPLVIYLTKKDESKFVAFHALQATIFQAVLFGIGIVLGILTVVSCGIGALLTIPVGVVVGIGAIVLHIIAAMRANEGQWYSLPVAGNYAKKSLGS